MSKKKSTKSEPAPQAEAAPVEAAAVPPEPAAPPADAAPVDLAAPTADSAPSIAAATPSKKKGKSPMPKAAKAPKQPKAAKPPKAPKAAKPKRMSCLDAAAKVLADTGTPMTTGELIEAMSKAKLWSSPNGQTPAATLYSAITREINVKGKDSRFKKTERGKFVAKA